MWVTTTKKSLEQLAEPWVERSVLLAEAVIPDFEQLLVIV
jgi:hypothetical protein